MRKIGKITNFKNYQYSYLPLKFNLPLQDSPLQDQLKNPYNNIRNILNIMNKITIICYNFTTCHNKNNPETLKYKQIFIITVKTTCKRYFPEENQVLTM